MNFYKGVNHFILLILNKIENSLLQGEGVNTAQICNVSTTLILTKRWSISVTMPVSMLYCTTLYMLCYVMLYCTLSPVALQNGGAPVGQVTAISAQPTTQAGGWGRRVGRNFWVHLHYRKSRQRSCSAWSRLSCWKVCPRSSWGTLLPLSYTSAC